MAFQHPLPAFNFQIRPVTAESSGCSLDHFFRADLHERSPRSAIWNSSFDKLYNERYQIVVRQSSTSVNFQEPEFHPIFLLPDSTYNELLTVNWRLMNFESKLSDSASTLPKRRSCDLNDQWLNPVKNSISFPFLQSSLLWLVWWNKGSSINQYKSSFSYVLNKPAINYAYQQLLITVSGSAIQ